MANLQKIYSDIDLTFNKMLGTNDLALRYDNQAVISSVRNLLSTNFYERLFQPNVGSNVQNLLFEPANDLTAGILRNEIRTTIENYEPRVKIDNLQVMANLDSNSFSVYVSFYIGNNTSPTAVNLILQRSR